MINLPASQLSLKLTKEEKENVQSMTILNSYKKELSNANDMKSHYLKCKEAFKLSNSLDAKNAKEYFYNEAIESWNKSQKLLSDYNEFEANRKYKKIY
jgi:hypothetical protein